MRELPICAVVPPVSSLGRATMFKRIDIQNFRTCTKVCLNEAGAFIALVGRNGAGKSNILQAIDWLARTATGTEQARPFGTRTLDKPTRFEVECNAKDSLFRYVFELVVVPLIKRDQPRVPSAVSLQESLSVLGEHGEWSEIVTRNGDKCLVLGQLLRIANAAPCLPIIVSTMPEDSEPVAKVRSVMSFLSAVRYYPLDEPNQLDLSERVITGDDYAKWLARYTSVGDAGHSIPMRLLHMALAKPDKLRELKSLIGSKGLRIVDDIALATYEQASDKDPAKASRRLYVLSFKPTLGKDAHLNYAQLSLGTRRVLHLLTSLIFDESSVMLVEQLEDGIHSSLMKKLLGVLRTYSDSVQIIASSHSSDVFNKLQPQEVRLVTMHSGETEVRPLDSNELDAALKFMRKPPSSRARSYRP